MKKIEEKIEEIFSEMVKTRRYLHSHPETGWFTFFTTATIAKKMKDLGYTLKMGREVVKPEARQGLGSKEQMEEALDRAKSLLNVNEQEYLKVMEDGLTGLVATIDTQRAGPCTAFRFDIDGVDVKESCDTSHKPQKDGFRADVDFVTHACGHDGHTAMGLGLAKLIKENLDDFVGKFVFIFQTAEEGTRGAVGMEPTGILKGIDYLFGAHIGFQAKVMGGIICGTNKLLATSKFDVHFKGKPAHAAGEPQAGANALLAAAEAAIMMHGITRHSDGVTRINVGVLRAGEGRNVIAPNGYMACETRGESTELNDFMFEKCTNIVQGVAKIHSVNYEIVRTGGTSGGDSSKEITEIYEKAALESPFIDNDKIVKEFNFGACEDFAHFMRAVQQNGGKSGYMMIGTTLSAGHHNGFFDFDENSLKAGVDILYRSALAVNKR